MLNPPKALTTGTITAGIILVSGLMLALLDRPWICPCGEVRFWVGDIHSPHVSQHLSDWYTATHILHGLLLLLGIRWLAPRVSDSVQFLLAVGLECLWEILENTPVVIELYRQQTMFDQFAGDTVINSWTDIGAMIAGFWIAYKLPGWLTLVLFGLIEVGLLILIRDSFLLNVLMIVYPVEAIEAWQLAPMN